MATTAVPPPVLTPVGFQAPLEFDILDGVAADWNAALGGNLNPGLNTPQGQIESSEAAIIGQANNVFLAIANGVDPAYASGRMQDAIGRIYFLTRNPAQPTVVAATCVGLFGVVIPLGALAQAADGNLYSCTEPGVIPVGGSITLNFACLVTGPVPCPANTLTVIYQSIPGWDTITNLADGVLGNVVESREEFEFRRAASVAQNSVGSLPAIRGAVLNVANVIDCYTTENYTSAPVIVGPTASITGSISTTTLTVSALASGFVAPGASVNGAAAGTVILGQLSGTTGGLGTYTVSVSQTIAPGTALTIGGVSIVANSIYVSVAGGLAQDVGTAIWSKKAPGCNYNGNTVVSVQDTAPPYAIPYPTYAVTFETPAALPFAFKVTLANNPNVPANALALVQGAIMAGFSGADGGPRARIGSTTYASRFYAGIAALGAWVQIIEIEMGSPNGPSAVHTSSIAGNVLTVGSVQFGALAIGDAVFGPGVAAGTYITAGSAGSWSVNITQTVSPTQLTDVAANQDTVTAGINQAPALVPQNIVLVLQ